MAKKKVSELQTDFFEFIPSTRDVSDALLEKEIYEKEGRKIARDNHPVLLKWRQDYFARWVEQYPDGNLARMMRRLNSERKE